LGTKRDKKPFLSNSLVIGPVLFPAVFYETSESGGDFLSESRKVLPTDFPKEPKRNSSSDSRIYIYKPFFKKRTNNHSLP